MEDYQAPLLEMADELGEDKEQINTMFTGLKVRILEQHTRPLAFSHSFSCCPPST